MNLLAGRSLRAATVVILALTFLGVLVSVYPIALFNTRSADKPIIPVWESAGEEQAAQKTEDDDTPTPTLSSVPAQIDISGATEETDTDPSTSEVVEAALVEAALREPFAQGPKKADEAAAKGDDDLPRAAFENPAARPADPVLSRQLLPPQTSPPDPPVDPETFAQAPPAPPDESASSPLAADSPPLKEEGL